MGDISRSILNSQPDKWFPSLTNSIPVVNKRNISRISFEPKRTNNTPDKTSNYKLEPNYQSDFGQNQFKSNVKIELSPLKNEQLQRTLQHNTGI